MFNSGRIVIGDPNLDLIGEEGAKESVHSFANFLIHQEYFRDRESIRNDIALIMLDKPAIFGDQVAPICLPDLENSYEEGQTAIVSGWDLEPRDAVEKPDHVLNDFNVTIMENRKCFDQFIQDDIMVPL